MDNLKENEPFEANEWISLSEPVIAEPLSLDSLDLPEENKAIVKEKKKRQLKAPIVTFQLIICLVFLIFLFVTKSFFPNIFAGFMRFYEKEINSTMISNGDFKHNSYESIFTASADEAQ